MDRRRADAASIKGAYSPVTRRQDDVRHCTLFQFRLSDSQSIGPAALRGLWARACGSRDVSVQRELRDAGFDKRVPVYLLCGPSRLIQVHALDDRLRELPSGSGLRSSSRRCVRPDRRFSGP